LGKNARAVNYTAVCAICGEMLDTNESSVDDVFSADGMMTPELHVDINHECFTAVAVNPFAENINDKVQ